MADSAILAGLDLVLKDDRKLGAVAVEPIGGAHQPDDLVALDRAGARIGRERPDRRDVVDVHRQDRAFGIQRHASAHAVVAGMDVGNEGLDPVRHELDRPPAEHAQAHDRHVLVIDMQLHAEGAADIGSHDAHARFRDTVMARIEVLELVGRLRRVMDRELALARIPVGEDRARLQRHCRMPAEMEFLLDDMGGPPENLVDAAGVEPAAEAEIVGDCASGPVGTRLPRGVHVDNRRQLLELHHDRLSGVLSLGARIGDHRDHRLAGPEHLLERQGQLRSRFHALEVIERAAPGLAQLRQIGPRRDEPHAGHGARLRDIDQDDAGMGIGAAQEGSVQHARQHEVGDVAAPSRQQALGVGARDRAADIGVRTVEGAERRVHAGSSRKVAAVSPAARRRATASIASTIAS